MQGRSAGSADTFLQAGQSLSPSLGASDATTGDTASSLDNTSITMEQGQRPRGQAPQLPQLGQAQPIPSRGYPSSQEESTKEYPSHNWVINLSSKSLTQLNGPCWSRGLIML